MKYQKVLFFFALLCGLNFAWAQDYKSLLKDSIGGDGYVYHTLTAKEDVRSISDLYKVSRFQVRRLNPILRRGFKEGIVIKLPANAQIIALINQYKATKIKNKYVVQHQDTKFGISKRYGITIQDLERLNPKIRQGLNEGDTLFVPKSKVTDLLKETDDFLIHLVIKGNTFYSLIKEYNVTKEELLVLNPLLSEGLKVGMFLRIPKIKASSSPRSLTVFKDSIEPNTTLNVLFLLPFKTSIDSLPFDDRSTSSKLRNIVTELYFGAEKALDSLSKQGVTIHAEAYDTENNIDTISKLFDTHDFSQFDLVVGPLFTKNISYTQQKMAETDAYILSPFSTNAVATNYGKANIVQLAPLQSELTKKTINYITDNYTNEKLIIITDTMPSSQKRLDATLLSFKRNDSINLDSIVIVRPDFGYINKDTLETKIDTISKRKNWVVTLTTDNVLVEGVINTLGVLPRESYAITMFSIGKDKSLDNLNNNYLARLNFFYPAPNYTDYESEEIKQFEKSFEKQYNNLPSQNAIIGFDMVYDVSARLVRQQHLIDNDAFGVSRRTAFMFDFNKQYASNKILNKGVFLLKYEGLSIKLVE
ncbi:MAG: LysM peptidoglycan-binding domain-containing protein [Flavobacteriales bacterium]|nr:LysM peptidoglycan-binding domain-containing protein [Flavobacteriales bacterium]